MNQKTFRIGIKYCGGCNPRYDRPALLARLQADFPHSEIFTADASIAMDYVVIFCGCTSACAEHSHLNGLYGKSILTSSDAYSALLDALQLIP